MQESSATHTSHLIQPACLKIVICSSNETLDFNLSRPHSPIAIMFLLFNIALCISAELNKLSPRMIAY